MRVEGIEPSASSLSVKCSTTELHTQWQEDELIYATDGSSRVAPLNIQQLLSRYPFNAKSFVFNPLSYTRKDWGENCFVRHSFEWRQKLYTQNYYCVLGRLKCSTVIVVSVWLERALVVVDSKKPKLLNTSVSKAVSIKIATPKKVKLFLFWKTCHI